MKANNKTYNKAFYLLTLLFFLWGFITVLVDSLIPRLRELFTLTYFEAGLVQFAFLELTFIINSSQLYFIKNWLQERNYPRTINHGFWLSIVLSRSFIQGFRNIYSGLLYSCWRNHFITSSCKPLCSCIGNRG